MVKPSAWSQLVVDSNLGMVRVSRQHVIGELCCVSPKMY